MVRRRERTHRLPPEAYRGQRTTAFTTCIHNRVPLFKEPRRAEDLAAILEEECTKHSCEMVIACFMPDHLHALVCGREDFSDSLQALYGFKLRSGVYLDRFCRPVRWQKDFYDHVVRCDEDWRKQAQYIALNPVRARLVEDLTEYPFLYSSLGDREEFLIDLFW